MTTHLECECERELQLHTSDSLDGRPVTHEALRVRHQAYEALVAEALSEEDEDERAERREMVELVQEFMRRALYTGDAL